MSDADTFRETVEAIEDGDPESVVWFADKNGGHFVIEDTVDDDRVEEVEAALNDAGFEVTGILPIPGMCQFNAVVDE